MYILQDSPKSPFKIEDSLSLRVVLYVGVFSMTEVVLDLIIMRLIKTINLPIAVRCKTASMVLPG